MISLAVIVVFIYAALVLIGSYIWLSNTEKTPNQSESSLSFSIVVPLRNEASNLPILLKSILKLNYPRDRFEVLFVDDYSEDNSLSIIKNTLKRTTLDYTILQNDIGEGSPKKRAISKAVGSSKFEIIATTDADCEIPPLWLHAFERKFKADSSIKFISGPVTFFDKTNSSFFRKIWNRFQQVEFSSLTGSGGVAIILGSPNMCSGANIAYYKSTFREVGGYIGNEHIASGDDEFLMHKITAVNSKSVAYLKDQDSIIQTKDQETWSSFEQQRRRWAGKWTFYQSLAPKLVAIFIFTVNLLSIVLIFSSLWYVIAVRIVAELVFLSSVLKFLKKSKAIPYIIPLQVLYPFYVVYFGLTSLKPKSYIWKGRKLK